MGACLIHFRSLLPHRINSNNRKMPKSLSGRGRVGKSAQREPKPYSVASRRATEVTSDSSREADLSGPPVVWSAAHGEPDDDDDDDNNDGDCLNRMPGRDCPGWQGLTPETAVARPGGPVGFEAALNGGSLEGGLFRGPFSGREVRWEKPWDYPMDPAAEGLDSPRPQAVQEGLDVPPPPPKRQKRGLEDEDVGLEDEDEDEAFRILARQHVRDDYAAAGEDAFLGSFGPSLMQGFEDDALFGLGAQPSLDLTRKFDAADADGGTLPAIGPPRHRRPMGSATAAVDGLLLEMPALPLELPMHPMERAGDADEDKALLEMALMNGPSAQAHLTGSWGAAEAFTGPAAALPPFGPPRHHAGRPAGAAAGGNDRLDPAGRKRRRSTATSAQEATRWGRPVSVCVNRPGPVARRCVSVRFSGVMPLQ